MFSDLCIAFRPWAEACRGSSGPRGGARLPFLPVTCYWAAVLESPVCVQASVKNIGRVVQRMSSADLLPELQSLDLLPGLFEAFDHSSADVRKAVTMCLMYMWQVCCTFCYLIVIGWARESNHGRWQCMPGLQFRLSCILTD